MLIVGPRAARRGRAGRGAGTAAAAAAAAAAAVARPRLEEVAAEVEEAAVGPVARCDEEDEKQDGAVHARAVEEVRAHEEEEDEGGRGVGRDEEEREPPSKGGLARGDGSRGAAWTGTYPRRQNIATMGDASV